MAVMVFLVSPLVPVVASSFSSSNIVIFPPEGFSLKWYPNIPANYWRSLGVSLMVAGLTAIFVCLLGVPATFALVRGNYPGRNFVRALLMLPLQVPLVVSGKVVDFPLLWDAWIFINCSKKPFDDVRVRQAIAYAIDYNKIIKDIERDLVLPLYGIIPQGMMGYNPKRFRYQRDVAKAKKLLAEAGYFNGFSTTLIYSPERRTEFEQESVLIQSFLKDIGVDVEIEKMAYTTQLSRQVAGNFDLAMMHFMAGTGDPSMLCHNYLPPDVPHGSPQYSFRWRNERVIELLHKGITIPDSPEREKIYAEVDDIGIREAAFIPLY